MFSGECPSSPASEPTTGPASGGPEDGANQASADDLWGARSDFVLERSGDDDSDASRSDGEDEGEETGAASGASSEESEGGETASSGSASSEDDMLDPSE